MTPIHTAQQSSVKPLDEKKVRFNLGSLVSTCVYGEIALPSCFLMALILQAP